MRHVMFMHQLFSRTEMSSPSHQSCHDSIRVILSLSWPYDNHGLTIFPESHTKNPAIWWYGHNLSLSLYVWCHVIISLVLFFYLRYNLERACVRGAKTGKRRFLGVLIMIKLWYLSLPDLCPLNYDISKCLRNQVIGSPTMSMISRFNSKRNEEKNNISPVVFLFYFDWSRSWSLYNVYHLWNMLSWSNSCLVRSLSMVFNSWLWLHNIYVNITNVLSDLPVVLYQLSRSIHHNSLIMWGEMSRKNNSYYVVYI